MPIVLQFDSRQNATYAYHYVSIWDSQTKRNHQKRTLIGKVDTATSLIIPTSGKKRKNLIDEEQVKQEIEAYNNKVLKERNKDVGAASEDSEFHMTKDQYDILISKIDWIIQALSSFAEAVQMNPHK